jgi:hypothetical protein
MGYNHGHNLISNVFFEEKEKVGVGGFKKKKKKKKLNIYIIIFQYSSFERQKIPFFWTKCFCPGKMFIFYLSDKYFEN